MFILQDVYVRPQSVPVVKSELEFEDSSFVGDFKSAYPIPIT